jgi:tRNA(fMet)-specific endonuclease VapC
MIYLFDTSIVVENLHNNPAIVQRIQQVLALPDGGYYLSSTVIGELYYGALHSKRDVPKAVAEIEAIVQTTAILPCDTTTAQFYGEIRQELTAQGQIIPENDLWIAAVARQHGLTLATHDAHFSRIGGLLLEQW